jgi:hypothetical protein
MSEATNLLLVESFFTNITVLRSVKSDIREIGLTRSFLFHPFRHQGKDGKQFQHHFLNYFSHGSRLRICHIGIEAVNGLFNRLEQVNYCVVVGAFDRLIKKCHVAKHMRIKQGLLQREGWRKQYILLWQVGMTEQQTVRDVEHLTVCLNVPDRWPRQG